MNLTADRLDKYRQRLNDIDPLTTMGLVQKSIGGVIESNGPKCSVGELCHVLLDDGHPISCEVVGFRDNKILIMPLEEAVGIEPGNYVKLSKSPFSIGVGSGLLGRILDGNGVPIDDKGPVSFQSKQKVYNSPPNPLSRKRITAPIATGVRSIDTLVTIGEGQRVGIFAGSGVGKSVLLGMMARNTAADISVIGLIGERGREVKDFVESALGADGLKRSVVVVVTSEQPAFLRVKGAMIATTIAEYFANSGLKVMLMMDSLTRVAMAQREVGLAIGEPPTSRGYTPSVFSLMPRLLERAGSFQTGSITGLYSVLVEGDDLNDPVADTARSVLDGHIVLSRKIAQRNRYPAVDVLQSVSRVMTDIVSKEHLQCANALKKVLAIYEETEDLINIGAYAKGSNPEIDHAVSMIDKVIAFQEQSSDEVSGFQASLSALKSLFKESDTQKTS